MSLRLLPPGKDDVKSGDVGGFHRDWLHVMLVYFVGGPLAKAVLINQSVLPNFFPVNTIFLTIKFMDVILFYKM